MKLQNKIGLGFLIFMVLFVVLLVNYAKNNITSFVDEENAKNASTSSTSVQ